jgi:hypothetical protein
MKVPDLIDLLERVRELLRGLELKDKNTIVYLRLKVDDRALEALRRQVL